MMIGASVWRRPTGDHEMASNQKLTGVIAGRTVKAVRQTSDVLNIDFEDGSTIQIQLKEPTSSVMVRDQNNRLEYTD
jgi:hypothetical protein